MIGLEAEFELGPHGAAIEKYGFTEYSFFQIINRWIATQKEMYGKEIPGKKYLMQYLKDSYRFVETYRAKELSQASGYAPETRILLTLKKAREFQESNNAYHEFIKRRDRQS